MKKLFSISIALIMLVAIFSACSKNDNSTNNNSDKETQIINYTYDYVYSTYDSSTIKAYQTVCDAVINCQNEAKFNVGMLSDVQQLLYTSFPFNYLISDIQVNSDNSGVNLTYKYDNATCADMINDFVENVNDIENECGADNSSIWQYIVNLYSYISKNANESDNSAITCYETVVNNEGTAFSYSNMFEYLLLQNDINAYHIIATDNSGVTSALTEIFIDGEYYFFSPFDEFKDNGGELLKYFGMTEEDTGYSTFIYSDSSEVYSVNENKFSDCRNASSYQIKDNKLVLVCNDKNITISLE